MDSFLVPGIVLVIYFFVLIFWRFLKPKRLPSVSRLGGASEVGTLLEICRRRDRSQSFDDWAGRAIELMAIDQVESGNPEAEVVEGLKEAWGDSWELFYPKAIVDRELSREGYWTALKKFDDKVAQDNGETIAPSVLDSIMHGKVASEEK